MATHLRIHLFEKDAALSEKLPILSDRVPYVAPSAVNPTKIRTNLICSETTILWQLFVADS